MARRTGPLRVLVVDADADTTASFATLLELWGYVAVAAQDGLTALARVAALSPDVVLLDLGLPDMSGFEVARRLRHTPATAGVVLVALLNYSEAEDRDLCRQIGFDHLLVKPPSLNVVRSLLDAQASHLLGVATAPQPTR